MEKLKFKLFDKSLDRVDQLDLEEVEEMEAENRGGFGSTD